MVVEAALTDGFLHASHPLVAWVVIVVSVVAMAWFAADYRALGRGAVRVDDRGLDLRPRRIGLRLDDPAAFVSAICSMLAGSPPAAI
jgi:hypothetical protein